MVKANELRVGNKLRREGIIVTIDARSIFDIWDESKVYEPIPLTPEILEKAGFRLFGGIWYEIDLFEGARKLSISIGEGWAIGDSDYMSETVLLDEKMYVHQLQNIYYTITKTELEINL